MDNNNILYILFILLFSGSSSLQAQVTLPEVVVNASGKDPAYDIIKNAQDKRKYYLDKMNSYSGSVYLKGTMHLLEIPKKMPLAFMMNNNPIDSNDLGLLFLSESMADFYIQSPDNYKEVMRASKVSGYSNGISWNRAGDVQFNFYDNLVPVNQVSDRAFVSPIAYNSMLFYKYHLLNTILDNGRYMYKIEVIPKRDYYPCFHGFIYIEDQKWNISGTDLFLTKEANIEFVDTIHFNQTFIRINPEDEIMMPLSVKITYQFRLLGFAGKADFNGAFSNYILDYQFDKNFFNNEVFSVVDTVNKMDTGYWQVNRPQLLTEEEKISYHEGDSLEALYNSPQYLDSIDRVENKFKILPFIVSGYSHYNRKDSLRWLLRSPLSNIGFNTVEGLNFTTSGNIFRSLPHKAELQSFASIRYGISSQTWYGNGGVNWKMNHINNATLRVHGGFYPFQYNLDAPIYEVVNTAYTLLLRQNYMKISQQAFANVSYSRELINGLFSNARIEWVDRKPLHNNTDYSWVKGDTISMSTNTPAQYSYFPQYAFVAELDFRVRFKQTFETYPDAKYVVNTKYPTLYFSFKSAIPLSRDYADYHLITLGIGDDMSLGLFGTSKFDVSAGIYLSNRRTGIYDFTHFNGNKTILIQRSSVRGMYDNERVQLSNFHTLDYYSMSTNSRFAEGHYEHHFNGFIFNKIPLLRKTKFQVVAGANFLLSEIDTVNNLLLPQKIWKDYTELFVGVENIFKLFRIDVATSYQRGGKIEPQLRIGLNLDL